MNLIYKLENGYNGYNILQVFDVYTAIKCSILEIAYIVIAQISNKEIWTYINSDIINNSTINYKIIVRDEELKQWLKISWNTYEFTIYNK